MYVQFYTRFLNKDEINYSYDAMGNRTNEVYARINKKGKLNYFKDFIYTTNNLNQYTNKELYNPNNESFSAESYEGQDEDGENNETPIKLNGKLIYDKNGNMIGNMIGNMLNNKRQYIYSYDYKNTRGIAKQERTPWGGLVKVEKTIYKTIEGTETNEVQETYVNKYGVTKTRTINETYTEEYKRYSITEVTETTTIQTKI